MRETELPACRRDRQQGNNSGCVVGNARAGQLSPLLTNFKRSSSWENGIQMCAERNHSLLNPGIKAQDVTDSVAVNFAQSQRGELLGQPRAAGTFAKRRSGNPCYFRLPLSKPRFLCAEPFDGCPHFGKAGEPGNS